MTTLSPLPATPLARPHISCSLSVVVISWNTRQLLHDCLASLYRKTDMEGLEVLVVDNASSDDSVAMVRDDFPDVRLLVNDENRGFAAANNQAIRIARGRHILLLNSDTVVLDDVINRTVTYLDDHPEVAAMGCLVLNPDRTVQATCTQEPTLLNLFLMTSGLSHLGRIKGLGVLNRYRPTNWDRTDDRGVEVISGCYLAVRRSAIEKVGLLDEQFFFFGEETDWCRRFRNAGWELRFAPVGTIIHHGSASAHKLGSRRDVMLTAGLVRYHCKHGGCARAVGVWLLLLGFNASRWLLWAVLSPVLRGAAARRKHFAGVIARYGKVWPGPLETTGT